MTNQTFDVIIIGAGPVGENVADRVVQGGLTAAIVERELIGGECSYWACMPTKALLRDAAALRAVEHLPGARAAVTAQLDVSAVLRRRDLFASHWKDDGQAAWLDSVGVTLFRGEGRISGTRAVSVVGPSGEIQTLDARHAVVITTGSSAHVPEIAGLAAARPWTSREAASTQTVPERLAIIGGGVVGVEMATAFSAFETAVTIVARDGLLPAIEPFARELLTESLLSKGVSLHLSTEPTSITRDASGEVQISLADGSEFSADEVLVATGRKPNTSQLGLENIGLTPGDWLTVDDALLVLRDGAPVPGEWLYAAGDVNKRVLLTHQGKYQARVLGDSIVARAQGKALDATAWGRHAFTADERAVPQVIFADPEIASVGYTVAEATRRGLRIRAVEYDLGAVAGAALHSNDYVGRASMVVDEDRGVIVGFTVVGPDVAELLHAATIAIAGEVPLERLWHAVPAYPTVSEVWLRLLETYGRDA